MSAMHMLRRAGDCSRRFETPRNECRPDCGVIGVCYCVYLHLYEYETKQNLRFASREVTDNNYNAKLGFI